MRPHTKVYMQYFGYKIPEDVFCEICGKPATEIHHIFARGMGGNPNGDKDVIENLMAVCREDHVRYGDYKQHRQFLIDTHEQFLQHNRSNRPKSH